MLGNRNPGSIVGLDLSAASIAATELRGSTAARATVEHSAVGEMDAGALAEGEVLDADALSESLRRFFEQNDLGKRVRLGLANQKLAVRVIRLPFVENPKELDNAIRFKAQDEVPMPVDQAVIDYRIVAHSTGEDGVRQVDVIVVAARREMISKFIKAMSGAGLQPTGIDLSAFGMIRALVDRNPLTEQDGPERPVIPGTLYCGVADGTTMAFARGKSCLFTRTATYGAEEIVIELARRTGSSMPDARVWLSWVGLDRPLNANELDEAQYSVAVQAREVLEEGARRLLDEIRPSIHFYAQQQGALPMEQLVVSGIGASFPGLSAHLADGLGLELREAVPPGLEGHDAVSVSRLATSYGLALEE